MTIYIIIAAILALFIFGYINNQKQKKLERERRLKAEQEEIARQKRIDEENNLQKEKLKEQFPLITNFLNEFENFKNRTSFISNYDIYIFKNEFKSLYNDLISNSYKHLPNFKNESSLLDNFLITYKNIDNLIELRNKTYLQNEISETDELLSNIENKSLDTQQRNAILVDEDNSLVIAGAGSGKTTTIAGKVKYLTERQNINPEEILLISFTRKSADEMKERIYEKLNIDISVKTFHKLGLDIIAEAKNEKPSIFSKSQKETLQLLVSFINNSKSNKQYFNNLVDFLAYYLKPYKDIHEFKTDAEHNNYLKEQKLEGYKMIQKTTKDGVEIKYRERFKSQEEVLIANFLFRNNIEYKYEDSYQYKTASKKFGQYKPDFYLPEYNIYIEHFGIDVNGNVPKWFKGNEDKTAQQKYTEGIEWKRNEHQFNNTTLVETYSWEQKKNVLLSNLKQKLELHEVVFNPMSDEELWKYINENTAEDIDVFTQLLNTFLVLFKSNNETIQNLYNKAKQEDNPRATLFLELFEPILKNYENFLKEHNEIDFSDMINLATKSVQNSEYISTYKYIIIDEFQDVSQSRYQLIKTLLDQNPATKLFCVGDDWQSIYRFAGSDIGIFTDFKEYFKSSSIKDFNRKTNTSYIENTYRFDNQIIGITSNFILKNPNQIEKTLKSNKISNDKPTTINRYNDTNRDNKFTFLALDRALKSIAEITQNEKASILLIGRYDFESKIVDSSVYLHKKFNKETNEYDYIFKENENLKINFLTAHKSKGLEADYVIILNGNSGTYGFPSEISDDPLLSFLLSKADQFPNGEERRLFYVALTRAKKHIYILSSNEYPSKFIQELEENEQVTSLKCEWCDNGKLVERHGMYGYFYSCNNNHYCNFTKKINDTDFYEIGRELFKDKKYNEAEEYFNRVLKINSNNKDAYYFLGRINFELKNYKEALKNFEEAYNKGFDLIYIHYNIGICLFNLNEFTKAIDKLLYFDNNSENKLLVNSYLSAAYFRTRHFVLALEYIEKEIAIEKNSKTAQSLKNKIIEALKEKYIKSESKVNSTELKTIKGYINIAIELDLIVKFNYHKSEQFDGGVQSLRTVKPKDFKFVGNSECLVGYCYMRNEDRTFNLNRISNLIMNPKEIEYWSED